MTAEQLQQRIEQQRGPEHDVIAWKHAGQQHDQLELLDYFLRRCLPQVGEVTEFSLLTLEDLWLRLQALDGDNLSRHWRKTVEVMDWQVTDAQGRRRVRSCCFRPEGVLAVYEELIALQAAQSRT